MRYLLISLLVLLTSVYGSNGRNSKRSVLSFNPLKGHCLTDKDCKQHEYCDHTGLNPIGSCKAGKENKEMCAFDRHCKSKVCHLLRCQARKPVRDGPCTKDQHDECLPEQYCSKTKKYICQDRKCSGFCSKDYHCVSNSCRLFYCKKSVNTTVSDSIKC